ncbi:hypothetical protein BUALT_Bualt01G0222500 [Buddleja alternifolia]|uniref:C2 domain-containing protein n=1 Tax=Buddleja alternifolia TaxID=168488 RepID=A0AAV6YA56_9LAMI|nr:hypothetical protein BUALT_Bualt01G0222500 [Buddleja alternifolia]
MSKSSSPMVIEITVISAENLMITRRQPVKKNAFIVVKSDPFNSQSTGTDPDGGSYPAWNEKLIMELPVHVRFITVEAHSGSKVIGTASIPVSDFAGGHLPENYLSFLSYRLRDGNGDKNGIVNLSVKVKGTGNNGCAASCSQPWMGVPADNKVSGGVVMGIPVPYT